MRIRTVLIRYISRFSTAFCVLANANLYADASYWVSIASSNNATVQRIGRTTVSETVGSLLPLPGSDTNVFAQAIAGPNELGVYGNVSATQADRAGTTVGSGVNGISALGDSLSLTNAPVNGILALYVNINGSSYTMAQSLAFPDADIQLYGNSDISGRATGSCVALDSGTNQPQECGLLGEGINILTLPYVLQSDDTVPMGLYFEAIDTCEVQYDQATNTPGSCIAASEFLDTAQVSSIVVEDSNGNPVPGTVTSVSGVKYELSANAPEPSSASLLAVALLSIPFVVRIANRQAPK